MIKFSKFNILKDYLFIMIGCFFVALALSVFFEPNSIVTGGAMGVSVIVASFSAKYFNFSIPMWLTNFIVNIPLFLIAFKVSGLKTVRRTLFATLFLSFSLLLTEFIPNIPTDFVISVVFGSVLTGLGLGLVFKSNCTTGGSDMAASLIHNRLRHISVAKIMFILDAFIITAGFFEFDVTTTFYSIISVYLIAKIVDTVLEGLDFAKGAFIVSDKSEEIADEITKTLSRGATFLHGTGAYSGKRKNVILCAVSKKEVIRLKDIVAKIDSDAFVMVADIKEVLGYGFKE